MTDQQHPLDKARLLASLQRDTSGTKDALLKYCQEAIQAEHKLGKSGDVIAMMLACIWAGSYHAGLLFLTHGEKAARELMLETAAVAFQKGKEMRERLERMKPHEKCGHSACSQHFIDTGKSQCIEKNKVQP